MREKHCFMFYANSNAIMFAVMLESSITFTPWKCGNSQRDKRLNIGIEPAMRSPYSTVYDTLPNSSGNQCPMMWEQGHKLHGQFTSRCIAIKSKWTYIFKNLKSVSFRFKFVHLQTWVQWILWEQRPRERDLHQSVWINRDKSDIHWIFNPM